MAGFTRYAFVICIAVYRVVNNRRFLRSFSPNMKRKRNSGLPIPKYSYKSIVKFCKVILSLFNNV